jgi:hypothetical protein
MELFKFEKSSIQSHLRYDKKIFRKVKEPIDYIINVLTNLGYSYTLDSLKDADLNQVKQKEGKNYNWCVINYQNVQLLIRAFRQHLTVFTKLTTYCDIMERNETSLGAFTFHSNFDNLITSDTVYELAEQFKSQNPSMSIKDCIDNAYCQVHDGRLDEMCDNKFIDFNGCLKNLMELIQEDRLCFLCNSSSFERPDYVDIETAFYGEEISSIDCFVFCMEEIDCLHRDLFSETTMVEKLKELKDNLVEGQKFDNQYSIVDIVTEVKDNYYHGVGISLIDSEGKRKWVDVYSLTSWYFNTIFAKEVAERKAKEAEEQRMREEFFAEIISTTEK